jgi:hypothetical protein
VYLCSSSPCSHKKRLLTLPTLSNTKSSNKTITLKLFSRSNHNHDPSLRLLLTPRKLLAKSHFLPTIIAKKMSRKAKETVRMQFRYHNF